jgi:ribosomal protein S18 acetylase RimI-like enzyme
LPEAPPAVSQALHEMGFVSAKRLIMRAELVEPQPPVILPPGCYLTPWRGDDFASAAEVIYRANVGTLDAQIIPELRALASTQRIVWQTLDGRYGWFDQQASGLALAADGEVVGVALVTRQEGNQGFTAEICVLPAHRRRGLARALMCRTHAVLMAHGLRECMLGVTGGNPARHLYESLGYAVIGSLWTYVWPKPDGWQGHEVGGSAPG